MGDEDVVGEADKMDDLINVIVKHEQTKPSDAAMSSSHKNMMRHELLRVRMALLVLFLPM